MSDIVDERDGATPEPGRDGDGETRPGDGATPSAPTTVRDVAASPSSTADRIRGVVLLLAFVLLAVRYPVPMLVVGALLFFIFMHELGHYLTAKWAGMKVTEFFIGFGPRLWSFRRGEVEYGIKGIPAGAYVKIIGMSNLEEVDPAEEHRTYRQKSYWRRLSVAVAGSTMHFLMAIIIMFGFLVGVGVPSEAWTVGSVRSVDGRPSPAEQVGLQAGDRIVAVDGERYESFESFAERLQASPGERVTLAVERDGERFTVSPRLAEREGEGGERTGFLGVGPQYPRERLGPLEAAGESVVMTGENMVQAVQAIGGFFTPSNLGGYVETLAGDPPASVEGEAQGGNRFLSPVGLVNVGSQWAANGVVNLLTLFFILNVFIGVINLFPMLPFDGGHVVIATYERIRSRDGKRYFADVNKLMPVAYTVILVFVVFIGLSSLYLDLTNPIQLLN